MEPMPESLFEAAKHLLKGCAGFSADEREAVMRALLAAAQWHGEQKRKSGVPYMVHPMEVASVCAEVGADAATVSAALLHDVLEDTGGSAAEIERRFGADVLGLVEAVTKHRMFSQKEFFEKMYAKGRNDPRVAVIKLADAHCNNRNGNQLLFSLEKHLEHLEELEGYYLDTLAAIPDVPKELVRMVQRTAADSRALYESRNA